MLYAVLAVTVVVAGLLWRSGLIPLGQLTGNQTTNGSTSGSFSGTQRDASGRVISSSSGSGKCQGVARAPLQQGGKK